MKIRFVRTVILLALPLLLALGIVYVRRQNDLTFTLEDCSFTTKPTKTVGGKPNNRLRRLLVSTNLRYGMTRPRWWPHDADAPNRFRVLGILIDSKGVRIPLDEINGFNAPFGAEVYGNVLEHVSTLRPRTSYDLSRGGTLLIKMQMPGKHPGEAPLWEDAVSSPLGATTMPP